MRPSVRPMPSTSENTNDKDQLSAVQSGEGVATPGDDIAIVNGEITWINSISRPMKLKLQSSEKVDGRRVPIYGRDAELYLAMSGY